MKYTFFKKFKVDKVPPENLKQVIAGVLNLKRPDTVFVLVDQTFIEFGELHIKFECETKPIVYLKPTEVLTNECKEFLRQVDDKILSIIDNAVDPFIQDMKSRGWIVKND